VSARSGSWSHDRSSGRKSTLPRRHVWRLDSFAKAKSWLSDIQRYGRAVCDNRKCNNTIGQGIGPCTTIAHVDIDQILADAAAQRATVLAAAGDSGAWLEGKQLVEPIPSDCRWVLKVGGMTPSIDFSGNYVEEVAWSATTEMYTTLKEPKYQLKSNINDLFGELTKPRCRRRRRCRKRDLVLQRWLGSGWRNEPIVPPLGRVHG
jgi:hypothetical protein